MGFKHLDLTFKIDVERVARVTLDNDILTLVKIADFDGPSQVLVSVIVALEEVLEDLKLLEVGYQDVLVVI